ncbi:MAG TPA: PadR family transcriptional regulator [Methanobacterium sp.]|nr:PadR family transcriptional regulator [Methanobacterium sp.]
MHSKDLNQEDGLEVNKEGNSFNIKNIPRHERKMIRGFMRGFGKIIILWLISKKRQHGYEIMTQLHEASPSNKMPSTSMIYPVLHKLEKKGLIKGSWEHHGKRKVKYYEITPEGEESLERIRKLVSRGQDLGRTNLYQEFMEDMFYLKQSSE